MHAWREATPRSLICECCHDQSQGLDELAGLASGGLVERTLTPCSRWLNSGALSGEPREADWLRM